MEPIPIAQSSGKLLDSKNVIYIENDDLLEDAPEGMQDSSHQDIRQPRADPRKSQVSQVSNVSSQGVDENSGFVLGDTGDHHFPKDKERPPGDQPHDMLLSEIAEEDSMSMISDRNLANGKGKGKTPAEVRESTRSIHSNGKGNQKSHG